MKHCLPALPIDFLPRIRVRWFETLPRTSSGSILTLFWSLTALLLVLSYGCNLRANLTAVEYDRPIDTVSDMLEVRNHVHLVKGSSFVNLMKTSPLPSVRQLYTFAEESNSMYVYTGNIPWDVMTMIEEEGGSTFMPKATYLYMVPHLIQRFGYQPYRFNKEVFVLQNTGFIFPKGSLWVHHFDRVISRLREMGIIEYLLETYVKRFDESERIAEGVKALNLSHFISSLLLLGVLLTISTIVFLIEKIRI